MFALWLINCPMNKGAKIKRQLQEFKKNEGL